MLTPAQLREGSRRARELALKETSFHLRQALAAHALDLDGLAEKLRTPTAWCLPYLSSQFDLVCTAERAGSYKPDGTLFPYLIVNAGVGIPEILHSGQSQFTDMVGGKPLGLTVAWINRRGITAR
jgi:hypothetical protein